MAARKPQVNNTSSIDYVGQDGNRHVVAIDTSNGRLASGIGIEIDGHPENGGTFTRCFAQIGATGWVRRLDETELTPVS